MNRAKMAIQCTAKCGTVGDFLFSHKDEQGDRVAVSPVFECVTHLYQWMKLNGWKSEKPHSLLTEYIQHI